MKTFKKSAGDKSGDRKGPFGNVFGIIENPNFKL